MSKKAPVLVLGGGELGSAIAYYLRKSFIPVAIAVEPQEVYLRRSICFAEAAFTGRKQIDDIRGVLITEEDLDRASSGNFDARWKEAVSFHIQNRDIPIFLTSELPSFLEILQPAVLIRTLPESANGVSLESADFVIGLHPNHIAGTDCHVAVDAGLSYRTGDVYLSKPQFGPDFDIHLFKKPFNEVLSPLEGLFVSSRDIGQKIQHHDSLGSVAGIEIRSPYNGQLWGIFHSGRLVSARQPLALIYEGPPNDGYAHFGFWHKCVAGAVLAEVERFSKSF